MCDDADLWALSVWVHSNLVVFLWACDYLFTLKNILLKNKYRFYKWEWALRIQDLTNWWAIACLGGTNRPSGCCWANIWLTSERENHLASSSSSLSTCIYKWNKNIYLLQKQVIVHIQEFVWHYRCDSISMYTTKLAFEDCIWTDNEYESDLLVQNTRHSKPQWYKMLW